MFQIWFNKDHSGSGSAWRIGYTNNYWFVNSDSNDWGASKWKPQKVGGREWPPDFVSQMANGDAPSVRIIPHSTSTENDFSEYVHFVAWLLLESTGRIYYILFLIMLATFSCILGYVFFRWGKKQALFNVPMGGVLVAGELIEQLQENSGHGSALQQHGGSNAPGNVAIGRSADSLESVRQHEVAVSGEQKGCVYVFDENDGPESTGDSTYIVIQVRYCRFGPPLLPTYEADGSLRWDVPDPSLRFDAYLAIAMERLTGKSWADRISPHLRGVYLAKYQAVVKQKDWRELWDVLLKPFGEQRMQYRTVHGNAKGPDIFFGVEAKPLVAQEEELANTEPSQRASTSIDATTSSLDMNSNNTPRTASSPSPEINSGDGLQLPNAAYWLDFWQNTGIPQQRTFVDFAHHVNASEFRRTKSLPDLADLANRED
jgi:hypothetical protein